VEVHFWLKSLSLTLAALCLSVSCAAVAPTKAEFDLCRQWVRTNLSPLDATAPPAKAVEWKPGLMVLSNLDSILMDGRPDGRPIKIGDKEFKRGMICHAVSRVVVRLPGPGKSFSAVVGLDANAGGGSVVFSVDVRRPFDGLRTTAFKSGVMGPSEAGVPVKVDLGGAREFTISAGDAGDGVNCDHADWADAKVILADGKEIWLSELPLISPELPQRSASKPPFSFVYGGNHSDALLPAWKFSESTKKLDERRSQRTQTYTDPKTGLQARAVIVSYSDFPTVEWTVYFKNTGSAATPILESIQALDTVFTRSGSGEFVLHHATGSLCRADDYEPHATPLTPGLAKRITTSGGRSTNSDMPNFNIEWPGQGVIAVMGWPGQWAAQFVRDDSTGLRVVGGQELTHLKLMPGEEIRTPLVVLQFWTGDYVRSQNIWRHWMVAHNQPKPGGKPMYPEFGGCHGDMVPNAADEVAQIKALAAEGAKLDHWIIDAGWYVSGGVWTNTGTWEPDKPRFPKGLREVADLVHENGWDFIVWFEPERVAPGTWLTDNHPEWVLGGSKGGLLNLGDPEAWKWVTNHIDKLLTSEGIDHYRGDYNIDPLGYWRGNDAEDRQGMTENLYVQGHLAFWDELLRRHPNMYIDTCASGGRRNDIESLRRSIPLLRSDYPLIDFTIGTAHGQQSQTYAISYWIPYFGTGEPATDMYTLRSGYCPIYRIGYDATDEKRNSKLYHRAIDETRTLFPYWLEDFYPLTPYSLEKNLWIAWQYDSPTNKGGFVQAFRRQDSGQASMQFKLQGLDPKASYVVKNLDLAKTDQITGKALMDDGIKIDLPEKPGSALIVYRKAE